MTHGRYVIGRMGCILNSDQAIDPYCSLLSIFDREWLFKISGRGHISRPTNYMHNLDFTAKLWLLPVFGVLSIHLDIQIFIFLNEHQGLSDRTTFNVLCY